ncbi:MAG: ABC transporter ATP-binding protein [Chloroflexi bacterium]|nr:ABC transporter ATP-binding protein [Chloroflexota bacterium]
MTDNIIEIRNVKKYFPVKRELADVILAQIRTLLGEGKDIPLYKEDGETPNPDAALGGLYVRAVDGVSFEVKRGEVFGLVGESGSGKTTTGRMAVGLLDLTDGEIYFDGIPLHEQSGPAMRKLRRRMQVIFQDPMASLNPRMTIGENIGHGLRIHKLVNSEAEWRDRVIDILERVGMTPGETFIDRFPHQISGGQRQRATIARALILEPELILADEPLAMADVSVRAVLLDLMKDLQEEFSLTYLFITHDLATAKYICDRLAIMYLGEIVEIGDLRTVFQHASHPYTEALLAAIPTIDPRARRTHDIPRGEIPNPIDPPSGCRFHPRCPIAQNICRQERPELRAVPGGAAGHVAACHLRTGDYQHLDPTREAAYIE